MSENVKIILPEPHYTVFEATRGELPEIISVNDALLAFPHAAIFPWHLIISIEATELGENGMPTSEESQALFEIGDALEDVVLNGQTEFGANNALFLARSTWNGWRELIFYVHNPEIPHAALQAQLELGNRGRHWEYYMEADPEWQKAGYVFQLFTPADHLKS